MWEYVTLHRMKRCAGGKGSRKVNSTLSPALVVLCRSRIFFYYSLACCCCHCCMSEIGSSKKEEKRKVNIVDGIRLNGWCDAMTLLRFFFFEKMRKSQFILVCNEFISSCFAPPPHNPLKHSKCVESRSSDDDDDDDDERAAAEKNDIEIYGSISAIPRNNTFPRHYPFSVV